MEEIYLRAVASRVSSTSPWTALEGLRAALQQAEAGLSAVAKADGGGLVKTGTYEKVSQDIVTSVSRSRSNLVTISREINRILQPVAATGRGRRDTDVLPHLEDTMDIKAGI